VHKEFRNLISMRGVDMHFTPRLLRATVDAVRGYRLVSVLRRHFSTTSSCQLRAELGSRALISSVNKMLINEIIGEWEVRLCGCTHPRAASATTGKQVVKLLHSNGSLLLT
jgi:hypothetical protein